MTDQQEKPVSSKIVSAAMRELAATIQCGNGVANAACMQAADMIDELAEMVDDLQDEIDAS